MTIKRNFTELLNHYWLATYYIPYNLVCYPTVHQYGCVVKMNNLIGYVYNFDHTFSEYSHVSQRLGVVSMPVVSLATN